VGLVVLGEVLEVGRQVDHRQPERDHAEPCPHPPEAAAEDRFELLDALDGHIWHMSFPRPIMKRVAPTAHPRMIIS
jgi:hypothetical protein